MTTNHHTPIPSGAAADDTTFNGPLSELDTEITAQDGRIGTLEGDMPVPSGIASEFYNGVGGFSVPAGTGSTNGHVIQDEGVDQTQRAKINFTGSGVTVVDTAGATEVQISSGGVSDHGALTGLADDDHPQYILHSLITAANDFLVGSGAGVAVKKTLAEVLTILGKGAVSGLASLNGSSKVVEDPANATATPTANKIPIADGTGKLDGWISSVSVADGSITLAKLSTSSTEADNVAKRVSKAWVNFNGSGTPAIRDDFNVSSITDNSTGNFTINFSANMANVNYSCVVSASDGSVDSNVVSVSPISVATYLTTSCRIGVSASSTGANDAEIISAIFFGG